MAKRYYSESASSSGLPAAKKPFENSYWSEVRIRGRPQFMQMCGHCCAVAQSTYRPVGLALYILGDRTIKRSDRRRRCC
eukprot:6210849-Pleurochrysis_carterae.AAC.1